MEGPYLPEMPPDPLVPRILLQASIRHLTAFEKMEIGRLSPRYWVMFSMRRAARPLSYSALPCPRQRLWCWDGGGGDQGETGEAGGRGRGETVFLPRFAVNLRVRPLHILKRGSMSKLRGAGNDIRVTPSRQRRRPCRME